MPSTLSCFMPSASAGLPWKGCIPALHFPVKFRAYGNPPGGDRNEQVRPKQHLWVARMAGIVCIISTSKNSETACFPATRASQLVKVIFGTITVDEKSFTICDVRAVVALRVHVLAMRKWGDYKIHAFSFSTVFIGHLSHARRIKRHKIIQGWWVGKTNFFFLFYYVFPAPLLNLIYNRSKYMFPKGVMGA